MKTRTVFIYGLIAGGIITSMMLVSINFLDSGLSYQLAEILGYLSMLIGFSAIYFGVKKIRDEKFKDEFTFMQAFTKGLSITLFASALYVIGWIVYITINGNNFMDQYFADKVAEVAESALSEADKKVEIDDLLQKKEFYTQPVVQAGMAFTEIFPVGLLISIVAAFILRTKKTRFLLKRKESNQTGA